MMTATSPIFADVDRYIDGLFAPVDDILTSALARARDAGLPEIHVSAGQGKLVYLLAKMIGARRILEIGTLGAYSTIWLARALPPDGRLVTLEVQEKHAQVARKNLAAAGLEQRVEVIVGSGLQTLPEVIARADGPFDLVFIDADKVSYPAYFEQVMRCVRSGSLILGDNVIRKGAVLAEQPADPSAAAARRFNAMLAADPRLEAIVLQQVGIKGHDGLAIARVR
jgi:predicted O-methyltransferase YrrM